MSLEGWRCTRRTVLKGAMLALAGRIFAGCEEMLDLPPTPGKPTIIGSFHIIGEGMYEIFIRWMDSLNEVDRIVFEKLLSSKDLLIHVFLATGRLPARSGGGASAPASNEQMKRICDSHPIVSGVAPKRNWDVAYDPERAKWFEQSYGILTPPEVVLHHEIFGHVLPDLMDPNIVFTLLPDGLFNASEKCKALYVENRYRRQIGLREVPPELMECLSP